MFQFTITKKREKDVVSSNLRPSEIYLICNGASPIICWQRPRAMELVSVSEQKKRVSRIVTDWNSPWTALPFKERSAAYLPYWTSPLDPELSKIAFRFRLLKRPETMELLEIQIGEKRNLGWQRPQMASPSPALTTVALPRARFSPIWPMFKATRSERLLKQNRVKQGRQILRFWMLVEKPLLLWIQCWTLTNLPSPSASAPTCSPEIVLPQSPPSTFRHAFATFNEKYMCHSNSGEQRTSSSRARNFWFLATKSVSQLSSTRAAVPPFTLNPSRPWMFFSPKYQL